MSHHSLFPSCEILRRRTVRLSWTARREIADTDQVDFRLDTQADDSPLLVVTETPSDNGSHIVVSQRSPVAAGYLHLGQDDLQIEPGHCVTELNATDTDGLIFELARGTLEVLPSMAGELGL